MYSVRNRMLALMAVGLVTIGLVATGFSYDQTRHEVDEMLDAELALQARMSAWLLQHASLHPASSGHTHPAVRIPGVASIQDWPHVSMPYGHQYERYMAIQVLDPQGGLVLASDTAPAEPMGTCHPGYQQSRTRESAWRVFVLASGDYCVLSGEVLSVRQRISEEIALASVAPFFVAIPLLLLLAAGVFTRAFKPLNRLGHALKKMDSRHPQPLSAPSAIRELAPIEGALNDLMTRIGQVLEREQRFSTDAAHELRTLLTVLYLHSDNARRFEHQAEERAHALDQLQKGIKRAEQTVTQLLQLARIEEAHSVTPCTRPVGRIRAILAELQYWADEREQTLALDLMPCVEASAVSMVLSDEELDIIVRNLVTNAIRYAPPGSEIVVRLALENGQWQLTVLDQGEGFLLDQTASPSAAAGARSDRTGYGIGLTIVRRLLAARGGQLRTVPRSETQQACVIVSLPVSHQ